MLGLVALMIMEGKRQATHNPDNWSINPFHIGSTSIHNYHHNPWEENAKKDDLFFFKPTCQSFEEKLTRCPPNHRLPLTLLIRQAQGIFFVAN